MSLFDVSNKLIAHLGDGPQPDGETYEGVQNGSSIPFPQPRV